jgi:uncharacterized protein (DUF3084 family)
MDGVLVLLCVGATGLAIFAEFRARSVVAHLQWTNKRLENLISQVGYMRDSARNAETHAYKAHEDLVMINTDRKLVREKNVQELNEVWRKIGELENALKAERGRDHVHD